MGPSETATEPRRNAPEASSAQVCVITGAASGVGRASVAAMIESGMQVVGVDLSEKPHELVDSSLTWVQGDVSAVGTWETVREVTSANPPNTLVLSAARVNVGTVLDISLTHLHELIETNLIGAVLALRSLLPDMISRRQGSIVFVSSVNGIQAEQNLAGYNLTKGAIQQLMRSVAVDFAKFGIRANAVCPTSIDTPFLRRHIATMADPEGAWATMIRRHPLGRILAPQDVAAAIRFLASDDASGITGTSLVIDCGLTATADFDPEV